MLCSKMNLSILVRNDNSITGVSRCETELVKRIKNKFKVNVFTSKFYPLPHRVIRYFNFIFKLMLPRKIRKDKSRILHLLDQQLAIILNFLFLKETVIVTVYDMYSFSYEYKRTYDFVKRIQYFLVNLGLRKVDYFIAISEVVKKQIIHHLNVPEDRISLMRLGIDHQKFKRISVNKREFLKKYDIPTDKKIVLYVGAEKPQKNFEALIRAFYEIKKECNDSILIKIGSAQDNVMRDFHIGLIKKLNLGQDIFFTGFVQEYDLPAFYNIADVFVMPSIDEAGFDLPVVEAMACGCPIIFCDESLNETVGNAGILVENSPEKIADAIFRVTNDKKLKAELEKKSFKQSKLFNWDDSARQLFKIYEQIEKNIN